MALLNFLSFGFLGPLARLTSYRFNSKTVLKTKPVKKKQNTPEQLEAMGRFYPKNRCLMELWRFLKVYKNWYHPKSPTKNTLLSKNKEFIRWVSDTVFIGWASTKWSYTPNPKSATYNRAKKEFTFLASAPDVFYRAGAKSLWLAISDTDGRTVFFDTFDLRSETIQIIIPNLTIRSQNGILLCVQYSKTDNKISSNFVAVRWHSI